MINHGKNEREEKKRHEETKNVTSGRRRLRGITYDTTLVRWTLCLSTDPVPGTHINRAYIFLIFCLILFGVCVCSTGLVENKVGQVPASITTADILQLAKNFTPKEQEAVVNATSIMGFLNRFM